MISKQQYEILCGISDTYPLRVSTLFGKMDWQTVSEAAIEKLVRQGLLKSKLEGELGAYTLVFTPTEKTPAAKAEYESRPIGRKERGR